VNDAGGAYLVPAFSGLGAPWWDMYARGTLVGITRGTGRAHVVRAALEAIAYQSADVLNAMEADAGLRLPSLKADGGASANAFLMQFQADLLGRPVVRPACIETTAMGTAALAGLGCGLFSGTVELASRWHTGREFRPSADSSRTQATLAGWHRAVERAKGWLEQ
jgi:glycerol kinase